MIITLCSADIVWEDKKRNFEKLDNLLDAIPYRSDVILLPEMFSTGFTMNTALAEDYSGESLEWLHNAAARHNAAMVSSIPFRENTGNEDAVYNRAFFVFPSGRFSYYDKRHLFRMGKETLFYTPGKRAVIVEYLGVKFSLNICYDLRFPVWSRNISQGYDVLINVANFPLSRTGVIEPLVRARAIENMAYAAFVNRSGKDFECEYAPSSLFVDYKGNISGREINVFSDNENIQIIRGEIDIEQLRSFREKFPAWMDADKFTVTD